MTKRRVACGCACAGPSLRVMPPVAGEDCASNVSAALPGTPLYGPFRRGHAKPLGNERRSGLSTVNECYLPKI